MELTLSELEEALQHLRAVPTNERGPAWFAYCDSLLEQRTRLAAPPAARRETRVVQFSETR